MVYGGVVYDSLERLTGLQPADFTNGTPGISKTGVISMGEQCPRPSDRRRTAHRLILSGRRGVGPIKAPGSEAVPAVLPGCPAAAVGGIGRVVGGSLAGTDTRHHCRRGRQRARHGRATHQKMASHGPLRGGRGFLFSVRGAGDKMASHLVILVNGYRFMLSESFHK